MGKPKKGQVAIEYVMIFGFAIVIVLPFIYYFFAYSQGPARESHISQMQLVARRIVDNAETAYALGEGTYTTFRVYIPNSISNGQIIENEVVFQVFGRKGTTDVGFLSDVNLSGEIPNSTGIYFIHVEAFEDYVNITHS